MARGKRTSGLIQTVQSFVGHDRIEMSTDGNALVGGQREGVTLRDAVRDPNSPAAGADNVPTYDGHKAFGVVPADVVPGWPNFPDGDVPVHVGGTFPVNLNNAVHGLVPPVTFTILSGALPLDILLNADGSFSGVITEAEGVTGTVTFQATGSDGEVPGEVIDSPPLNWEVVAA